MTNERTARIMRYALIALGAVLVILVAFMIVQYRALRRERLITTREFWITSIIRNHGPLTANDANIIRPWMTFDYINKIFNLPADYLKTNVPVGDEHYPALTLGAYARGTGQDPNAFAVIVENAVRDYMAARAAQ